MTKPLTITESNFAHEVLQAPAPVLVDFWAPWCGPCHVVGPVIDEIASQYDGSLKVGKLNVDDHPAIAQRYGITGIPALLFFRNGDVVDTIVGAVPRRVVEQHVASVVSHG